MFTNTRLKSFFKDFLRICFATSYLSTRLHCSISPCVTIFESVSVSLWIIISIFLGLFARPVKLSSNPWYTRIDRVVHLGVTLKGLATFLIRILHIAICILSHFRRHHEFWQPQLMSSTEKFFLSTSQGPQTLIRKAVKAFRGNPEMSEPSFVPQGRGLLNAPSVYKKKWALTSRRLQFQTRDCFAIFKLLALTVIIYYLCLALLLALIFFLKNVC